MTKENIQDNGIVILKVGGDDPFLYNSSHFMTFDSSETDWDESFFRIKGDVRSWSNPEFVKTIQEEAKLKKSEA